MLLNDNIKPFLNENTNGNLMLFEVFIKNYRKNDKKTPFLKNVQCVDRTGIGTFFEYLKFHFRVFFTFFYDIL